MAEYIEREAISEGIRKYYYKNPPNSSYEEGFDRGLDRAQRAILDAPAADVVPVRHGRWEQVKSWSTKAKYRCSVCGREIMSAAKVNIEKYPYCHCGAKMDGGADNG